MKIVFAGTPAFAAGFLETLVASTHEVCAVVTQPDKPGKRGKKLIPSAVKQIAISAGLKVLQPEKLATSDLSALDFDLMIVVAYGQILKPDVLTHPPLGCINVHASMLPRWRGAAPVQRAIMAGDTQTGITLIQMDAGLDTGDMIDSCEIPIGPRDTAGDVFANMTATGKPLLIETLNRIERGKIATHRQDDDLSTYARKIAKQDALINWTATAVDIDRLVRAFQPEPIAFTFFENIRIRIHRGQTMLDKSGPAGEILEMSKAGLLVATGEGGFLIEQLQLPLGKGSVLKGADIINGFSDLLKPGMRFAMAAP